MGQLLERLSRPQPLIADGATGTNLQKRGLPAGAHTEDWIFEAPEKILDLERAFVEAGADIILTCTFGGTRLRMKGSSYADKVGELNIQAAKLARRAASARGDVLIAGSMGPLGQLLRPYGPVAYEEAAAAYAEQARALSDGGVDLLLIETQFALEEANAAVEGVRSVTDLPIVVSFSYDRGTRTMMGVRPSQVADRYSALHAALIGVNCGTTLENAASVLGEYGTAIPGYPLWAKPNAGLPRVEGTTTIYDVTPAQLADFGRSAVKIGARVVGGCCGSTPEHIRELARALKGEGG